MAKAQGAAPVSGVVDFRNLLNKPSEEAIIKPPPIPAGTWEATIRSHEFDRSRKKKTPLVRFNWTLTGPGTDILQSDLEGVKWQGKTLHQDFYITDDALYRIPEFFERLGVPIAGKSVAELIQASAGTPGLLSISHRTSEDPESENVYPEIDSVANAA